MLAIILYGVAIIQSPAASKRVLKDITSGRAAIFDKEMTERVKLYDESTPNIVLQPLKEMPRTIYQFDIKEDPGHWINQGVCLYYRKESVLVNSILTPEERLSNQKIYKTEVGPGNLYYRRNFSHKD